MEKLTAEIGALQSKVKQAEAQTDQAAAQRKKITEMETQIQDLRGRLVDAEASAEARTSMRSPSFLLQGRERGGERERARPSA